VRGPVRTSRRGRVGSVGLVDVGTRCDTRRMGRKMTPREKQEHRVSARFLRWVIDQAQAQGHVMTDPATWLQVIGHQTGYRSACSCGWSDPDPVRVKKHAYRHALAHLGGEVGDAAGMTARKALAGDWLTADELEDAQSR